MSPQTPYLLVVCEDTNLGGVLMDTVVKKFVPNDPMSSFSIPSKTVTNGQISKVNSVQLTKTATRASQNATAPRANAQCLKTRWTTA